MPTAVMEVRAAEDVLYIVEPGVLDRRAVAAFTLGQCHGMALALHERTGWPMVAAYDVEDSCQHVLADAGDDRFVDIAGARTRAQLLAEPNFDRVEAIDQPSVRALSAQAGWAVADCRAAQPWLDQVIERGTSGAEPMAARFLARSAGVDDALELVFRWGGTQYIDVLVRRPGTPEASWIEWRCFRVPPSRDGFRRVHFTDDDLLRLMRLWLDQQFDPEPARVLLARHSRD
jgi:hypothetical protein